VPFSIDSSPAYLNPTLGGGSRTLGGGGSRPRQPVIASLPPRERQRKLEVALKDAKGQLTAAKRRLKYAKSAKKQNAEYEKIVLLTEKVGTLAAKLEAVVARIRAEEAAKKDRIRAEEAAKKDAYLAQKAASDAAALPEFSVPVKTATPAVPSDELLTEQDVIDEETAQALSLTPSLLTNPYVLGAAALLAVGGAVFYMRKR
jgi:hypothetical protein